MDDKRGFALVGWDVVWVVASRLIGGCGDDNDDSGGVAVDKGSELRIPLLLILP